MPVRPDAGDLCTYADVKARLRLQNDDAQQVLQDLITGASEDIRQETMRHYDVKTYTEYHSGRGVAQTQLWLRQWPVIEVTSLKIDGYVIPKAADNQSPGYWSTPDEDSSRLLLNGYYFSPGNQNIEVSYRAGYSAIPADLKQACIRLVQYRFKADEWVGQRSKSLGGEVVSFVTDHMPAEVLRVCQRYKKVISS